MKTGKYSRLRIATATWSAAYLERLQRKGKWILMNKEKGWKKSPERGIAKTGHKY